MIKKIRLDVYFNIMTVSYLIFTCILSLFIFYTKAFFRTAHKFLCRAVVACLAARHPLKFSCSFTG